ncbi:MAG TPA: hypothetical protein VF899_17505 [Pyrinomonadaceae bacterium]
MGDQNTDAMNGKRPFEERVFARFDALDLSMRVMDSSMRDMDARLQKLEVRTYDTKPIWEQALKEIVATRRELSKRLDRIEAIVYETRSDLRDAEDRIDKIERKPIR